MSHQAFRRALAHFDGNQSKFAAAIGTSQQNISNWVRDGKSLPAEFVLPTERETGVSRHDLRPDLYPREDTPAAEAA
jgi:DNA-binding transcriptional regulator YdaS (Cro superfamily)